MGLSPESNTKHLFHNKHAFYISVKYKLPALVKRFCTRIECWIWILLIFKQNPTFNSFNRFMTIWVPLWSAPGTMYLVVPSQLQYSTLTAATKRRPNVTKPENHTAWVPSGSKWSLWFINSCILMAH